MTTTRRLAAILAADVQGYSRLMAADEVGTLAALKAVRREVVDPAIAEHNGRIVKTTGDGMLVEFASAVDAVNCAMAVQEKITTRGGKIVFRIGINVGDIIIDGDDIFGDGVNVAARLENECKPGSVYLSAQAFDQVRNKTQFDFDDLGERQLKNIDRPVRIYAARLLSVATTSTAALDFGKPIPLPDKPSIAVLPFQNMSGDREQDYFADGMVEDIITALSRFKSLFVIARNSSFIYKDKAVDIQRVGRELGVRYVLEGSVRKAGGRLRITGQLIETETNHHVWADRFDGAAEDIFDLQDKITEQVVGALKISVEAAEILRSRKVKPYNFDAYDLYLKARSRFHEVSYEANVDGLKDAYRAIEMAPDYGAAYAIACDLYVQRNVRAMPFDQKTELPEALRLARRALELAPDDAEVLTAGALALGNLGGDLTALGIVARATELNPNYARAWHIRGAGCFFLGDLEQTRHGIEFCKRALRLGPLDPYRFQTISSMAQGYVQLEQFEDAYAWAERAYETRQIPSTAQSVIIAATLSGREQRARELVENLLAANPEITIRQMTRGIVHWRGERDKQRVYGALRQAGLPE